VHSPHRPARPLEGFQLGCVRKAGPLDRASPAVAQQWQFASRASSGGTPQATGIGAEGGRSLLGVARGVLRLAEPCGRALPIPVPPAPLGGRCTPPLAPGARAVLRRELEVGRLSGRGLHRVRRVARTIADLDGAPDLVSEAHVATALRLRTSLAVLSGGHR
jgi:hypothetical protein